MKWILITVLLLTLVGCCEVGTRYRIVTNSITNEAKVQVCKQTVNLWATPGCSCSRWEVLPWFTFDNVEQALAFVKMLEDEENIDKSWEVVE